MNLSQEALAEKVYVTRQTISNWENNKNYPDIHSLLLLSSLFNISLDQLIKGDIKIMKEEINKGELQKFNRDGALFTLLLLLFIVSVVPLAVFLGYYGLIISGIIYVISMYFAIKVEKYKKINNIQTFKEIVSFTEGKRLDEIEKAQEYGKRPYQKVLYTLGAGIITFIVCMLFVWLLKSFIF
jgi:transcriptional regulator with XRE-family HTH domain